MNKYLNLGGTQFNIFEKCNITSYSEANFWVLQRCFSLSLSQLQNWGPISSSALLHPALWSWLPSPSRFVRVTHSRNDKLGLQRGMILTQSLGSYQERKRSQPNSSSATAVKVFSPVTFPDGKVLLALTISQKMKWVGQGETFALLSNWAHVNQAAWWHLQTPWVV